MKNRLAEQFRVQRSELKSGIIVRPNHRVHLVRHSLRFVTWKDRKAVARDLKTIYRAATVEQAELELLRFAEQWDGPYPTISRSWQRHWDRITPYIGSRRIWPTRRRSGR